MISNWGLVNNASGTIAAIETSTNSLINVMNINPGYISGYSYALGEASRSTTYCHNFSNIPLVYIQTILVYTF